MSSSPVKLPPEAAFQQCLNNAGNNANAQEKCRQAHGLFEAALRANQTNSHKNQTNAVHVSRRTVRKTRF